MSINPVTQSANQPPILQYGHLPDQAFSESSETGFQSFIRGRRSIRRYQTRPIPRALVEQLLEAAIWAPSAHNRQPWRFCVITEEVTKLTLSRRMGEKWRQDLSADHADPTFIEHRVKISHARITGASALIVLALSMAEMDQYNDARRDQAEWVMAVQSVALAGQNLLLAAHHHGLGACWMCAPLFAPELVRDVLDLPTDWQPQALITLGYAAEEKTKTREPLETRVLWR